MAAKYEGFEGSVTVHYAGPATVKQTKKDIQVTIAAELSRLDHCNFRGAGKQDEVNPLLWIAKNNDDGQKWLYQRLSEEDKPRFEPFVRVLVERNKISGLLRDEAECDRLLEIAKQKEHLVAIQSEVAEMIEEQHGAIPEASLNNWYEAKQEARAERLAEYAANAEKRSTEAWERSHNETKHIPFGQPILVGHHSEKKHRSALSKSWNLMGKSVEEQRKAEYFRDRAASVGSGGISSDDPDAIRKLQLQLFPLMTGQMLMVEANKIVKSKTMAVDQKLEALAKLGFKPKQIADAFAPDFAGRVGFADYQTSNNRANIKRINDRIDQLRASLEREDKEYALIDGYLTAEENAADNRIYLHFPGKPPEAERQLLKSNGFRWNRTANAWSRQLTGNAVYAAQYVGEQIKGLRVA